MIGTDHFRFINAVDVNEQTELFDTDGLTVFNMEIMDDLKTAYAIMGKTGWEEIDDGMFE